jgi:hypothetical protein
MTLEELRAKVRDWDISNTATRTTAYYGAILDQLDYHAAREWRVYLPAEHPEYQPSYMERLAKWIGNLTDEAEQKLLLEYALHISFFSHADFIALYRTALNREATRWIISQVGASLQPHGGQALHDLVYRQLHYHTWFCPVTDSMDINEFYKVNHLVGIGHRPGFYTLQMLAEDSGPPNPTLAENILHYMADSTLERIILLEDVVGSADQCIKAVRWAVDKLRKPILFIPLILCPNGADALRIEEQRANGLLEVRPVVELRRGDLLGPERQSHKGWVITEDVENLAIQTATKLHISTNQVFGFRSTGCSLATFSNTPDNSIPMIHRKSGGGSWEPLFPRIAR